MSSSASKSSPTLITCRSNVSSNGALPPPATPAIDPRYAKVRAVAGRKGVFRYAKVNNKLLDTYKRQEIYNLFAYHGLFLPDAGRDANADDFNDIVVEFLKNHPFPKTPPSPKPKVVYGRISGLIDVSNIKLPLGLKDPLDDDESWQEQVEVLPPFPEKVKSTLFLIRISYLLLFCLLLI